MPFFITFEGVEGSGKTTQLLLLMEHLRATGYQVVATREPGGCPIADTIRALLLDPRSHTMDARAELLLYSAARAQHVAECIRPALEAGIIVLCDRFTDATTVYQGAGRGLDAGQIEKISSFAAGGLTPDLTLLLDYPVEGALQRARTRNRACDLAAEGRFEEEDMAFHQRIREAYLQLAAQRPRISVIDAVGEAAEVAQRIKDTVEGFLARGRTA